MANGNIRDEYKHLNDNMRHYANMRFAQLTLYFALSAGLVTVVFGIEPPPDDSLRLLLKGVGVVASLLFVVMEERAADYWHHLRRRAVELEISLGYRQYTDRPVKVGLVNKYMTATNAARAMIWGGGLLWLAALIGQLWPELIAQISDEIAVRT